MQVLPGISPSAQTTALATLTTRRQAIARLRTGHTADDEQLRQSDDVRDRPTSNGVAEVLTRLSDREARELKAIDAALDRITSGTWGTCVTCGKAIAKDRLASIPEAATCVGCAG